MMDSEKNREFVMQIFEDEFAEHCDGAESENKYEWCSNYVFDFATYDAELDEIFIKKIFEVCKAVLERRTFEFIEESDEKYRQFIIVCQIFYKFNWISWGTSIRGAWFEENRKEQSPIIEGDIGTVYFSEENLKLLIEFVERKDESKDSAWNTSQRSCGG